MAKDETTPVNDKETADVKTEDLKQRNKNKRFMPESGKVVTAKTAAEATAQVKKETK